jgi:hypothetical protein
VTINGDPNTEPTTGAEKLGFPVTHIRLEDFLLSAGGRYAIIANTNNQYYYYPGDHTISGNIQPGLYFAEGDLKVNNVNWDLAKTQGVTLVARGKINVNVTSGAGSATEPVTYYKALPDGVFAFANWNPDNLCASTSAIDIHGSEVYIDGVVLAPNGLISANLSSTWIHGTFLGQQIDLSGSEFHLEWTPSLLPPVSPKVSIAK